MTADPVREQVSAEEEELRKKVQQLRSHRSMQVACAIEMELSSGAPRRNLRRLALGTSVGDNTIRDWMRGDSTPTWDAIKTLVADLHPEGRLSDPLEWLLAGRAYLESLVARLEELARARLAEEIEAGVRAELKNRVDAQAFVAYVAELPGASRDQIVAQLAKRMGWVETDKKAKTEDT
jgi:hypothetical protein